MKKVLYGTTALLAAGMFTVAANAAPAATTSPIKLTIGGYMNAWMGYANLTKKKLGTTIRGEGEKTTIYQNSANQFAVGTDGVVSFNLDAKLSNNLSVGGVAELVVAAPNLAMYEDAGLKQEWLKDVYGYADTKFGKVEFGATANAANKMHHGAPDVGIFGVSESKLVKWIGVNPMVTLDSTAINFDGNNKKISYFTPKFYGLQVGLTWTPGAGYHIPYGPSNGAQKANVHKTNGLGDNFANAGVASIAYNNKFGGVEVGADFGFGLVKSKAATVYEFDEDTGDILATYTEGQKASKQYSFGLDVGFSGFKIGAGYTWFDQKDTWKRNGMKSDSDKALEVGAAYENGPFGVSANYFYSKNGTSKYKDEAGNKIKEREAKFHMLQVSGKYKLGAGVDAFATFGYLKFDRKDYNREFDLKNTWTITTGLALKF